MVRLAFTESTVENAAFEWLRATGWEIAHAPEIAPGSPSAKRADFGEVVLARRLRDALLTKLVSRKLRGKHAEQCFKERCL
jgi:type I restriction enzyme R subunit